MYGHTGKMINSDRFSDVCFKVEGRDVFAHRAFLAARCDHFRAMFESGMKESHESEVAIPHIRHVIFVALIEYIYTDMIEASVRALKNARHNCKSAPIIKSATWYLSQPGPRRGLSLHHPTSYFTTLLYYDFVRCLLSLSSSSGHCNRPRWCIAAGPLRPSIPFGHG